MWRRGPSEQRLWLGSPRRAQGSEQHFTNAYANSNDDTNIDIDANSITHTDGKAFTNTQAAPHAISATLTLVARSKR